MSFRKVCPQCGAAYGAESRFCSVDGAALVSEQPAEDLVGSIIADRYHILERIGIGGMGQVYLAEHVRMKRKSALKVMREALTSDPIAVSRFHREAENASQITHPNVAAVYDFGETSSGLVYIAMEYVPGEPLSAVLESEGALNPARVGDIIAQAADALSAAHGLGILHRDLKPDNIMLSSTRWGTDLVKLVDFGISRAMESATQQFTSTGMIVGTPDYMSPEQLTGDSLDPRSDQYALGLIAYFALTGLSPFPHGSSKEALLMRLTTPPRKLADAKPEVAWPDALQATLDRALSLDVNERYEGVEHFGMDFEAAIGEVPPTETMEHYREALRQRFSTPSRAPSVTPPRAMPSVEMTPPRAVPSLETMPPHAAPSAVMTPPAALPSMQRPAEPDAAAPAVAPVPDTPSLGTPQAARPSTARRLTAVAASVGLVAFLVWRIADAGPQGQTGAVPLGPPPDTSPLAAVAAAENPISPAVLLPAVSLDSAAAMVRRSVFPVLRGAQQGSAFLVDSIGIVLTSAEFAAAGAEPSVQLDAERRVVGRVIAVDSVRGVAALRIPIQHCRGCSTLAINDDTTPRVAVGDSLVVPAATTRGSAAVDARGAVTGVNARGVQTSLRLTERASGAPVLAPNGAVLGMALRRGRLQTNVVAPEVLARLRALAVRRRAAVLPNDTLVPIWPAEPVARILINSARSRRPSELTPYKIVHEGIEVLVMTPQVMAWRQEEARRRIEGAQLMALGDSQPGRRLVDPIQRWREWDAYVAERRAVVAINAIAEAAGYGKLTARSIASDLRRGDVVTMRLLRGDTLVRPIAAALFPAVVNPEAYRRAGQHVYTSGVATYHPREFARRPDRTFPPLTLEIQDGRPRRSVRIPIGEAALSAIERDLAPFQR